MPNFFVSFGYAITFFARMLFFLSLISLLNTRPQEPLTLTFTNLKDTRSPIVVGIFRKDDPFTKKTFKNYTLDPAGTPTPTLFVDGLPYGEYAIAIFQDSNRDGKLNTNILGIPKEPYCFSNNVRPRFSAPKYEQCKFTYSEREHHQFLELLH
jgi:uncharacterized protein (DUF2141 family)